MNLGQRLRVILAIRGMKMSQLARKTGVSFGAIEAICSGRTSPRADTLTEICKVLEVSADHLLGLEGYQNEK